MNQQQTLFLVARIGIAIACLAERPVSAHEHIIKPIQHFGIPSSIRIIAALPKGWQDWGGDNNTMISFVPHGAPTPAHGITPPIEVQLAVTSHLAREVTISKDRLENPRNSLTATWMESATRIKEFEELESFDGGLYGKLPLWLVRGGAYSYYLVIIHREDVLVEVSLRSDAGVAKLKDYAPDLKRLVRSIRIEGRDGIGRIGK